MDRGAEPPANVTVPIARLIVKMSSDSDNNDKELVKNTISNFINDDCMWWCMCLIMVSCHFD